MAKEKTIETPALEVKGKILFQNVDPLAARFELEDLEGKMLNNRRIQFAPDFFPKDFDPTVHEVTGSYVMTITIRKK